MSNPQPVTPHIHGHVSLPSTGFGSPHQARTQPERIGLVNPGVIRSSGTITAASANAAANDAARRLRRNTGRLVVR